MKPLAKKLHDLRIAHGCLSQMQLSELTGISQSSLARWELGQSEPRASEICILCRHYKISADELLELENFSDPQEQPPLPYQSYDSHSRKNFL